MDFQFTNHGSVTTVEAISDAAIDLANDQFGVDDWQGIPTRFTTDWRPAEVLASHLVSNGWSVHVKRVLH